MKLRTTIKNKIKNKVYLSKYNIDLNDYLYFLFY